MSSTPLAGNRRTPAGVKSQQRVKDILQAGRDVFAEKGYDAATSAEIAQRAGISEATVFSYFSGKRELCERVIAEVARQRLERRAGNRPPAGGALCRMCDFTACGRGDGDCPAAEAAATYHGQHLAR